MLLYLINAGHKDECLMLCFVKSSKHNTKQELNKEVEPQQNLSRVSSRGSENNLMYLTA